MNDEELRKLLQNSLAGRRAPADARDRVVASLRPRRRIGIVLAVAATAAAAILVSATLALVPRAPLAPVAERLNPTIARAIEQHIESPVFGHAASSATVREVAQTVSEASGRDIQMPGLRDGGFTQMQAHRCEATGWAHVVYANSWLKVSCFILDAEGLDLSGGKTIAAPGIDAHAFAQERFSVVAVRESGLAKIWVGDLRPEQLALIAVDAEQKRHQMQTKVFSVTDRGITKQMGAVLVGTPGIEEFLMEPGTQEATVKYDRRRVTLEEIAALLATNGFAASPRDWGGK